MIPEPARPDRPVDLPLAPAPRSWAARYGEIILADGIAALPTALFYYQGRLDLTAQEVWFVCALLARPSAAEVPVAALPDLAAETGVSIRQLQYLRAGLGARALLAIQERHTAPGGRAGNGYDLTPLLARLEAVIAADPTDGPGDNGLADDVEADSADTDGSFHARYGRVIVQRGIAAVPRALYRYEATLALSPQQVWFASYILAHRWTTALPYPSLVRMAERTGYSRRQLQVIKDSLVAQGHLQVVTRQGRGGGRDANGYDFSPLLDRLATQIRRQIAPPLAAPVGSLAPDPVLHDGAATARRPRRGRRDPVQETAQPLVQADSHTPPAVQETAQPPVQDSSQGGVQGIEGPPVNRLARGATGFTGGGAMGFTDPGAMGFTRKESNQEDSDQEERESNRLLHPAQNSAGPYSAYIAGVVADHSRELGDNAHDAANRAQALRVWQTSGLPEDAFVALLHATRTRVRLYQGKQGGGSISNKMAYYFITLRSWREWYVAAPAPVGAGGRAAG